MNKKRIISLILALTLVLSAVVVFPFTVSAADADTAISAASLDEMIDKILSDLDDPGAADCDQAELDAAVEKLLNAHDAMTGAAKDDLAATGGKANILGDADRDGDVTVMDATRIQRWLAELCDIDGSDYTGVDLTDEQAKIADADEDGDVSVMDATAIQRHMADLPTNENIGQPLEAEVLVESIGLYPSSLSLSIGETYVLEADVYPSDAANKTLDWSSSNTGVATVTNFGKINAVASGTATIYAKATDGSGVQGTCKVTVAGAKVTSISVSPSSVSLKVGESKALTATVSPSNAANKTVQWSSSNTSVATVSSTGTVTAKAAGSATIYAKAADGSGVQGTCSVSVTSAAPTDTTLTNYNKLRTYINNNPTGRTSEGERYIAYQSTDKNGGKSTAMIVATSTGLNFLFLYSYNGIDGYFFLDTTFNSTYSVMPLCTIEQGYYEYDFYSSIDARKITSSTTLRFINSNSGAYATSSFNDLCNTLMQLAMINWEILVYGKTGLQMRSIGFTSYIVS